MRRSQAADGTAALDAAGTSDLLSQPPEPARNGIVGHRNAVTAANEATIPTTGAEHCLPSSKEPDFRGLKVDTNALNAYTITRRNNDQKESTDEQPV